MNVLHSAAQVPNRHMGLAIVVYTDLYRYRFSLREDTDNVLNPRYKAQRLKCSRSSANVKHSGTISI